MRFLSVFVLATVFLASASFANTSRVHHKEKKIARVVDEEGPSGGAEGGETLGGRKSPETSKLIDCSTDTCESSKNNDCCDGQCVNYLCVAK